MIMKLACMIVKSGVHSRCTSWGLPMTISTLGMGPSGKVWWKVGWSCKLLLRHFSKYEAMYYIVIKHDRHQRTQEKCRKHEPWVSAFLIVLKCRELTRLLHLLYDIHFTQEKQQNSHIFSMFYILIKHGYWVLTNQSMRRVLSILYLLQ